MEWIQIAATIWLSQYWHKTLKRMSQESNLRNVRNATISFQNVPVLKEIFSMYKISSFFIEGIDAKRIYIFIVFVYTLTVVWKLKSVKNT